MIALTYSEEYEKHDTGDHPENKERLRVIINSLKKESILDEIDVISPKIASKEDLLRVHTKSHVEYIESLCRTGGGYIDFDTLASPDTYKIARLSAGGAITASKLVLNGYESAYSIARPPGHHATRDRAMGFCFFNNVAIAVEYLREVHKIKKFLIFDFDAHYGNGTADIFYRDPSVLYISIHQDPRTIFPGVGFIEEIGKGEGEGYNMNIPMPPGSSTYNYVYVLEELLEPVARQFDADFYFVEVGFDGHMSDPLSNLNLNDNFYEWIINKTMKLAGSMALILEGGYNLDVLSRCNVKIMNVLGHKTSIDDYKDVTKVSDDTKKTFHMIRDTFSPFFEF